MTLNNDKRWTVYILRCADNSLYTGITNDVDRRVLEHNNGKRGASYTRGRRPVELVYQQSVQNRSTASQLEYWLKAQSKQKKEFIIRTQLPLPSA